MTQREFSETAGYHARPLHLPCNESVTGRKPIWLFEAAQPDDTEIAPLPPIYDQSQQPTTRTERPRSRAAESEVAITDPAGVIATREQTVSSDTPQPLAFQADSEPATFAPIPIDRTIQRLLKGPPIDVHAGLDREGRDMSSVPFAESQLAALLQSDAQLRDSYEDPQIVCRETMCEFQMALKGDQPGPDRFR